LRVAERLDLTARGRQENRDWLRHHDRYDAER